MNVLILSLFFLDDLGISFAEPLSESELISRLCEEEKLELIHRQRVMIREKDRALKRLLAKFTGTSYLSKNWLNSKMMLKQLLEDPERLREKIIVLLERQNTLLLEKDDQIEDKDKIIKFLDVLCCAPMYVTTHIEQIQKKYFGITKNPQDDRKNCLRFISRSSDPFAESMRKELKFRMSAKKFCDSIFTMVTNFKFHLSNFLVNFRQAFYKNESLLEIATSFKVEKLHVKAFNILLKTRGLPNINITDNRELQVQICKDRNFLEQYYSYNSTQ